MINYFNFRKFDDDYLITNDAGCYAFVDKDTLGMLIKNELPENHHKYDELKDRLFVFNEHKDVFAKNAVGSILANKSYLTSSTSLFIFIVTKRCNMNCIYCQANAGGCDKSADMTMETAKRGVDIAMSSPSQYITIEFQGGEPLLNFEVVKYIVEYSQSIKGDKNIEYCIATNLSALTEEILDFFAEFNVSISTSFDGNRDVHTYNRQCSADEFDRLKMKVKQVQSVGHTVSAIQTTTRYSLNKPKEIIDEYVETGFNSIFIRPLTKLGMAIDEWSEIGYTADEFLEFYRECLSYIIELNKRGIAMQETHASILLKKILKGYSDNYMELRSPCGAGVGQIAIYHNGEVYTCDEGRMLAEMGNKAFMLGNVYDNTYDELMESPVCKAACAASVLEAQLSCCDCVYQPYCGVCPVVNLASGSDIVSKTPRQFRCEVYGGILDTLFQILKSDDEKAIEILYKWA